MCIELVLKENSNNSNYYNKYLLSLYLQIIVKLSKEGFVEILIS